MLELRQIQTPDYATVNEIFSEALDVAPPKAVEYIANLCVTNPEGCLVATLGGEVVAYVCTHRSGSVGYIGTVAVLKAHRGNGYGRVLTEEARDYLLARCDVVGLAVEPDIGRNLQLYSTAGFVPTLPSCIVWRQWPEDQIAKPADALRSAAQLGSDVGSVIESVRAWTEEVFPGLDFTADLLHFATNYPGRLWFDMEEGHPRGFLAYEPLFRGDVWGCVRPGAQDLACLSRLVDAVEATSTQRHEWFHFHACFGRILPALQKRGYRITGHKTSMVLASERSPWPTTSDSILIRPWWT